MSLEEAKDRTMFWQFMALLVSLIYTIYSFRKMGANIEDIEDYHAEHGQFSFYGRIVATMISAIATLGLLIYFICSLALMG